MVVEQLPSQRVGTKQIRVRRSLDWDNEPGDWLESWLVERPRVLGSVIPLLFRVLLGWVVTNASLEPNPDRIDPLGGPSEHGTEGPFRPIPEDWLLSATARLYLVYVHEVAIVDI